MKAKFWTSVAVCFSISLCATTCFATEYPVVFQENGKYGYMDQDEEVVIPAEYTSAEPFDEDGLALVSQDIEKNGWPYEHGYIDAKGEVVVPLLYQQLGGFVEGFALAQKNGKFGYISPDGEVAVDFLYSEASDFYEGKAVVKLEGEMLVIERPNWEPANLSINEAEYRLISSSSGCISYLEKAFAAADTTAYNESDYLAIEKLISHMTTTMPTMNASISGNTITLENANYDTVVASSKGIYEQLVELFRENKFEITSNLQSYLSLMEQGIANVKSGGQTIITYAGVEYTVVPFPIPYFNPEVYKNYTKNTEFNDYLARQLSAMGNSSPNKSGSEGLVEYINYIFANLEPLHLSTNFNKVVIGREKQEYFFKEAYELTTSIYSVLSQYNVTLQEDMSNELVVVVNGNNLDKTVKYEIQKEFLDGYLSQLDGIRVVVGTNGQGVYLPSPELRYLFDSRDKIYFEVDYGTENTAHLTFFDVDGKTELLEFPVALFLTMPATSRTVTTFAFIENRPTENWGGIVKSNNTIEFATPFSGEYLVREAATDINDIGDFSLETQAKIHFMVSKGLFTLENGNFNPDEKMTRTELVSALVKLFFVQDSEATSSFKDVAPDSEEYALISAAYQAGIATGYEDNTFRGENITTREEIVSFLARTLSGRKGYQNMEDPQEVVKVFEDWQEIPSWALENVALAVEHNLVENYGSFNAFEEVSRREVAQLLYGLFFSLYDSTSETPRFYEVKVGQGFPVFLVVAVILAVIAGIVIGFVRNKIEEQRRLRERMDRITTAISEDLESTD